MAPLEILPGAMYSTDPRIKISGAGSFPPFVNDHASHLVLVLANILRSGKEDGSNYRRLQTALEAYKKPIVVFGLGVQAPSTRLEDVSLPDEAISLMQFLSSRANAIGVRGPFTKRVLEELCGVTNVFVTGCPSLYARPEGIRALYEQVTQGSTPTVGRHSFNVTNLARPTERMLLARGILYDGYLIEPVSKVGYDYHVALNNGSEAELPYYFRQMIPDGRYALTADRVANFYRDRFHTFRTTSPWFDFNRQFVSWSYGTRFHVNMATLLAGKPALWLTHDSRTEELTEFMHLPHLPLDAAANLAPEEMLEQTNYDDFFDHVNGLFDNFSEYLQANGLPGIAKPL